MIRCESTHSLTGQQCIREQDHDGPHDLPGRARSSEAEKKAMLAGLEDDLHSLVGAWASRDAPPEAMLAQLLSFTILAARASGMPETTLIRSFVGMLAPDGFPVDPTNAQAISYVVSVLLDLPIKPAEAQEVIIRGQGVTDSTPPASQPS